MPPESHLEEIPPQSRWVAMGGERRFFPDEAMPKSVRVEVGMVAFQLGFVPVRSELTGRRYSLPFEALPQAPWSVLDYVVEVRRVA